MLSGYGGAKGLPLTKCLAGIAIFSALPGKASAGAGIVNFLPQRGWIA
ncbi:MAG: hypothetical protein HC778_06140 [Chamaesiphon sp. CSU_1_12]|nr:hypothetical protein [Chamaesiphon sp. CSU_1_12]